MQALRDFARPAVRVSTGYLQQVFLQRTPPDITVFCDTENVYELKWTVYSGFPGLPAHLVLAPRERVSPHVAQTDRYSPGWRPGAWCLEGTRALRA